MFAVLSLLVLAPQITSDSPGRLGEIASRLSADDLAQLERLAGERPWLLIGHPAQVGNNWSVEVYGRPRTVDRTLRRGTMVWAWTVPSPVLATARAPEPAVPRQWTTGPADGDSWAQVALPGRALDDLRSEQDVNRPFRVAGVFRDAELVSLVEFIRSGPELPGAERRAVNRTLPIDLVARREDGLVAIHLRVNEWAGDIVHVRPVGQGWSLVSIGEWIN